MLRGTRTLLAAIMALLPLAAFARLGETELESRKRYGEPMKPAYSSSVLTGATNLTYKYQGWRVRVAFVAGRAARIAYSKEIKPGVSPTIRDDEAAAVLEGEAGGGTWREQGNLSLSPTKALSNAILHPRAWKNTNGNFAYLQTGSSTIVVEAPAAKAFEAARAAEKERQRKAAVPKF